MNYKNFSDLSADIRDNFHKIQSSDFDLIVGIPRSGMIPAYMIGLHLNAHITDLNGLLENKPLTKGITRNSKKQISNAWDAEKILLVDDSVSSGLSMQETLKKIPLQIQSKLTKLAIYSDKKNRKDVDIFFVYLPHPRIFEWNIFHHSITKNACLDIDGVLCVDPLETDNDDDQKYLDFIQNAPPLFIPSSKVFALVTSRLSKYRRETETWLKKYNIEYEHLIMLENTTAEERREKGLHAPHKANFYKNCKADLFIESDSNQAAKIAHLAKKPVYCVDDNLMYQSEGLGVFTKNVIIDMNRLFLTRLKQKVKSTIKKII